MTPRFVTLVIVTLLASPVALAQDVVKTDCQKGCDTILEIAISPEDRAAMGVTAPKALEAALQECIKECKKLPKASQVCFGKAKSEEEFTACEKKEAKPDILPQDSPAAVVPDKLPARKIVVPSCETVCYHILDIALDTVPADKKEEARAGAKDVVDQCLKDCRVQLNDAQKICFYQANSLAEGEACEEAGKPSKTK